MANYPLWPPHLVAASTYMTAGLVSELMMQLSLMQADVKALCVSGYSTLASYLHVIQSPLTGNLKTFPHNRLLGVTANQHHLKSHSTSHNTGASDAIQNAATNARRGFETTTQYKKINTFEQSSTRNLFRATSYIGNGTSKYISFGKCPKQAYIMADSSVAPLLEFIRGNTKLVKNNIAITIPHSRVNTSGLFVSGATGLKVKGSANTVSITYYIWVHTDYKTN